MTNPLADPSMRRFLLALAGTIATVGNKKLGLGLEPNEVLELLVFLGGVIAASNMKAIADARASGAAAAAGVVAGPKADAIVDAAAGRTP